MTSKPVNALKVSLHGMNTPSSKKMTNYLKICCNNTAYVVNEHESDAEIIDLDLDPTNSKHLLNKRLEQKITKPIIALSIHNIALENVIYVKKPIEAMQMINAIETAKTILHSQAKNTTNKPTKLTNNVINTSNYEFHLDLPNDSHLSSPFSKKEIWGDDIYYADGFDLPNKTPLLDQKETALERVNTLVDEPLINWPPILPNEKTIHEPKVIIAEDTEKLTDPTKLLEATSINTSPIELQEIDKLLKELKGVVKTFEVKLSHFENMNNNRKIARYSFQSIKAKLIKKRLIGTNMKETVDVLNASSKGALIRLKTPVNFNAKVTLKIYFDPTHIFDIPARVVRKESNHLYGILFLNYQHELADYLIESSKTYAIS